MPSKSIHFNFKLLLFFLILAFIAFFWVRSIISSEYKVSKEFDGIRLTLSSPKYRYKVGDTVTVKAVLKNISHQTIILESTDAQQKYVFDIQVDGAWLSDVKPELHISRQELKPGGKIEVEYSFLPNMRPHSIQVNAYVNYRRSNSLDTQNEGFLLDYGVLRY